MNIVLNLEIDGIIGDYHFNFSPIVHSISEKRDLIIEEGCRDDELRKLIQAAFESYLSDRHVTNYMKWMNSELEKGKEGVWRVYEKN